MGECHVHAGISPVELREKVAAHPRSELFIHPECGCTTSALWLAESGEFPSDRTHVLSTSGMVKAAQALGDGHALVATETGSCTNCAGPTPGPLSKPSPPGPNAAS